MLFTISNATLFTLTLIIKTLKLKAMLHVLAHLAIFRQLLFTENYHTVFLELKHSSATIMSFTHQTNLVF
jgi:hypothetical protein